MENPHESRKRNVNELLGSQSRDSSRSQKPRYPSSPICRGIPPCTSSASSDSEDSSADTLEDATSFSRGEKEDEENGEDDYDYPDVYRFVEVAESPEAPENRESSVETLADQEIGGDEYDFADEYRSAEVAVSHEAVGNKYLCYRGFEDLTGLYDSEDRHYEKLFEGEEKNSYRQFCTESMIYNPQVSAITTVNTRQFVHEENSSPFVGQEDEVEIEFQDFISDVTGDGDDIVRYLRFRNDDNDVTVALSMEEIKDLEKNISFMATGQHIDTYVLCRLSQFPREIQERVNRCSAYMISLNLHDLNDWKDEAPLRILMDALDIQMKEVDFNIIPLLYGNHWTLAIVCGFGNQMDVEFPGVPYKTPCVLHFNSVETAGIRKCHKFAIAKVVAKKTHIKPNEVEWHEIESPQQTNSEDCGFYVMRFAVEFLKNLSSTQPVPVPDLFHYKNSSNYAQDEASAIIKKVQKKARLQLKGFIGSINKDDRDLIDEFSEGRQCTMDILPYCTPKEIIKSDGDDYVVQMLNKVKPISVPKDYVKNQWQHIYARYTESIQTRMICVIGEEVF